MSEVAKCPCCEGSLNVYEGGVECKNCPFQCAIENFEQICAAMELAKATRTLEDAMEPLNSGKRKMGQALPAIRLAMEDQRACEQRVLEVFK